MKARLIILSVFASVLVACNEPIGDASLVDGAWELQQVEYDKSVYANLTGATHYTDDSYTRTYKDKEMVWLFYQGHISWWQQYNDDGNLIWGGYMGDAEITYTVEGEGKDMVIVQTSRSTIPGIESTPYVTRYKVEKLSKGKMVLTTTSTPYVSELDSVIQVQELYSFKRENTLMDYILSVYPKANGE